MLTGVLQGAADRVLAPRAIGLDGRSVRVPTPAAVRRRPPFGPGPTARVGTRCSSCAVVRRRADGRLGGDPARWVSPSTRACPRSSTATARSRA